MECTSVGSFTIVLRLASSLKAQPDAERRARNLRAFLSRYSASRTDVLVLLEALTCCTVDAASGAVAADGMGRANAGGELSAAELERVACRTLGVASLGDAPFRPHGSLLTLKKAHELGRAARLVGAKLLLERKAELDIIVSETCRKDFEQLLVLLSGDVRALLGATTLAELLRCLGAAVDEDATRTSAGLVRSVSAVVVDSPRQFAESFVDDGAAGVAAGLGGAADDDDDAFDVDHVPAPADDDDDIAPVVVVEDSVPAAPAVVAVPVSADPEPWRSEERPPPRVAADPDEARVVGAKTTTAVAGRPLPPCKYGASCIRKNPAHFKEFSHPADFVPAAAGGGAAVPAAAPTGGGALPAAPPPAATPATTSGGAKKTNAELATERAINGVKPDSVLPEYEFVEVDGVSGGYKVKYCGANTYTCNCPVWRYQNKATDQRTCKHIQQLLGMAYENERCHAGLHTSIPGVPVTKDLLRGGAAPATGAPVPHAPAPGKHPKPGLLLANKSNHPKTEYNGWWVSEKLDGVRAYWDGKNFLSREGNRFDAPAWFTDALPKDVTLDGELFGGRKMFQKSVGIVKSSAAHPGWANLRYMVFDIPCKGTLPFESRMEALKGVLTPVGGAAPPAHIVVVEQERITGGRAQVSAEFERIMGLKGEGLMLRQPGSKYVPSRSSTLLKIKGAEEVDARVIGYDKGEGKHTGRMGALLVELANHKQFKVGTGFSDAQRDRPPKVGAVIVVKYQELTDGGVPRHPVFGGERAEATWPPPS